jgi:signal transduction histidine kinase
LTGRRSDEAVGRPLSDLIPGWERGAPEIPIADRETRTRSATIPVESDQGDEIWLSIVAVRTSEGVIYAFRDLSEDQRLEQAKSDFIATISHELRTPLAAVLGAAQTLLRDDVDFGEAQRRKLLEMIATQATRLARITDDVLLATSLDRGDIRVNREEVDVGVLANETATEFAAQLPFGFTLDVEAVPAQTVAWADRDKLQQVLANLVDNAIKYSPGGGAIRVTVDEDEDTICLGVADTGLGIPALEHERIFDKFYRADPQHLLGANGTGLGLYICRELIERMDGRISVESEPGAGSIFRVELPSARSSATSGIVTDRQDQPEPRAAWLRRLIRDRAAVGASVRLRDREAEAGSLARRRRAPREPLEEASHELRRHSSSAILDRHPELAVGACGRHVDGWSAVPEGIG